MENSRNKQLMHFKIRPCPESYSEISGSFLSDTKMIFLALDRGQEVSGSSKLHPLPTSITWAHHLGIGSVHTAGKRRMVQCDAEREAGTQGSADAVTCRSCPSYSSCCCNRIVKSMERNWLVGLAVCHGGKPRQEPRVRN